MYFEALSLGKPKVAPGDNEDMFVALPRFGFAVIDGLSDRTGHRYDGLSAGQMAARLVAAEVTSWLATERHGRPASLVERLTARIAQSYRDHDIMEIAMAEPGRRFGATLSLAIELDDIWRFVLIGDSGIRLNGLEVLQNDHPVDIVTAALRREAYRLVLTRARDPNAAAKIGRAVAFHGVIELRPEMSPWLTDDDLSAIRHAARCHALEQLPDVPEGDIAILLDSGIVRGQGYFQNNTLSPMSYAVLDGTDVPVEHVSIIDRTKSEIAAIELFSDGYMRPPAGATVDAWEESFANIEALDPAKIGEFACPKGSTSDRWFDDRTIVIVRPDPHAPRVV